MTTLVYTAWAVTQILAGHVYHGSKFQKNQKNRKIHHLSFCFNFASHRVAFSLQSSYNCVITSSLFLHLVNDCGAAQFDPCSELQSDTPHPNFNPFRSATGRTPQEGCSDSKGPKGIWPPSPRFTLFFALFSARKADNGWTYMLKLEYSGHRDQVSLALHLIQTWTQRSESSLWHAANDFTAASRRSASCRPFERGVSGGHKNNTLIFFKLPVSFPEKKRK